MNKLFKRSLVIFLSFFIAYILTAVPIKYGLSWLRPDFITMTFLYWTIHAPYLVGVLFAFVVGLIFDIATDNLLGKTSLSLVITAFFAGYFRLRFRQYSIYRQLLIILVLLGMRRLISLWIQLFLGTPPFTLMYWFSIVTSLLVWPVMNVVLNWYQTKLYN